MNKVTITVSGAVGSGKSALCGEIEILCKALGLQVDWIGGQEEKNLTHADWTEALEMYKPSVTIAESIEREAAPADERAAFEQWWNDNTTWPVTSKNIALHAWQARAAASQPAAAAGQEARYALVPRVLTQAMDGAMHRAWKLGSTQHLWDVALAAAPPAPVANRQGMTEIEYEKVRLGLHAAKHFIANGISLGFIRMPDADCPDPAHNTPKLVDEALALLDGAKHE
ncbi:hypothetical protein LGM89_00910 [Burkholderia sp. AU31624]|uniref:hypothetical protein n=1 Tax=Burkholderia sp. AU31624 TaxID=2879629 RepID=UPI001CF32357|nr:hypothetical protein [Burkholderia sp. AU31624]MCA8251811.1 hypothetical protein [Burkholderia sp. AU31624]